MAKRYVKYPRFDRGYTPLADPFDVGFARLQNVRARPGGYAKRPGRVQLGDVPDANRVTSIVVGAYTNADELLRCQPNTIYTYDAANDEWDDVTPITGTLSTTETDIWRGVVVRNTLYLTQNFIVQASPNVGIIKQASPAAVFTLVNTTPAGEDLVGFLNRLFVIGGFDTSGTSQPQQIYWSTASDQEDFTGVSSGFTTLVDDGYPCRRGLVLSGRLLVLKGDSSGGSVVIGTPTADANAPVQFETLRSTGILCPNTLVRVGPDTAYFLGHDNFYRVTAAQIDPEPVANLIAEEILGSMDYSNLHRAFTLYGPGENDLMLVVPTSDDALAAYSFNMRTGQWGGPEDASTLACGAPLMYQKSEVDSWSAAAPSNTWTDGPDVPWSATSETIGRPIVTIGTTTGKVGEVTDDVQTDFGSAFTSIMRTGADDMRGSQFIVTKRGRRGTFDAPVIADGDDLKGIDEITIHYVDYGAWVGTIAVSTDGGTSWTSLGDVTFTGSGTEGYLNKRFTFDMIVGTDFMFDIQNANGTEMFEVSGIAYKARYIGARR